MLASKKKDNTKAGRNSSADSTYIYNIPFVRENENYVNASLNLKITGADTTFGYSCDWQYQNKTHGSPNVDSTAERHAVYFMILDHLTLGHTQFTLLDSNLFPAITNVTSANRRIRIEITAGKYVGRSSEMQYFNYCENLYHCGAPTSLDCRNGCDFLHCNAPANSPLYCYGFQVCYDGWYDDGNTGGDGGGYEGEGSGAGGNGGSGSGGGTPPNCTPGHHRSAQYPPCEPGWIPEEDGGGNTPPNTNPCDVAKGTARKMDTLYMKSNADSVVNSIPNLATETKEKGFPIYVKFNINPNNVHDTTFVDSCGTVQTGNDSSIYISFTTSNLRKLAATLHTHPKIGYAAQSANDIYTLIETAATEPAPYFKGNFVAAYNGDKYAITITDPVKAAAFYNTKNQFLNGADWDKNSIIGKAFKKAYDYFENGDSSKRNYAYEMALSAVLKQFDTGVILSKKDAIGNFKPIVVNTIINPRRPRKIIYAQDCL